MAVLYSDLEMDDSSKIVHELDIKKIPYELLADGAVIKVPENQVLRVRMSMAQAGLPNKGSIVGYEIFNNEESLGSTTFQQNIKMVRALEGEISRTISSFEQIERARVHLVLPQKEIFSKDKQDPKASVVLKLKNHQTLGKSEIDAIGHLVSTAVPGLDIKNVTIVDTKGRSLKLGSQDPNAFGGYAGGGGAEEYRVLYEQRMKQTVESLLEQSLGAGKVKAQISVEMNFDRIVTNSEIYDPDGAVIRSVQSVEEKERNPMSHGDGIDISVANNIPGGNSGVDGNKGDDAATIERNDETTNYEISKTVKNQISETGTVKQLSIAILIDGTYKVNASGGMDYIPREAEELKKIENLVKVAVGFRDDRKDKIEVINMQFLSDLDQDKDKTTVDWIKEELPMLFQTLVFAVVVVLVFITVVRPIALKVFDHQRSTVINKVADSGGVSEALEDAYREIDIKNVGQSLQNNRSTQKVGEIIQSYPQETLMVLRKWLNENG